MNLKMFLINVDESGKIISLLDDGDYPVQIRRDDNDGKNFFVTRTHFRKNGGKEIFIPAFKILLDNFDTPAKYTLALSADKDDKNPPPLFCAEDLFFDYSADKTERTLGFEAGVTYIFILKNGKIFGKPHKLLILPSALTEKEFLAMIGEIISIRSELVRKSTGKVGLPQAWFSDRKQLLFVLNERVDELFKVMQRINRSPRRKLKQIQISCGVSKLRRFDAKIMRQYTADPQRQKYITDGEESCADIFENRFLLNKLEQLLQYILNSGAVNQNNSIGATNEAVRKMAKILGKNPTDISTVIAAWQIYSDRVKKEWQLETDNLETKFRQFKMTVEARKLPVDIEDSTIKISFKKLYPLFKFVDNVEVIYFRSNFIRWRKKNSFGKAEEIVIAVNDIHLMATLTNFFILNSTDEETVVEITGRSDIKDDELNGMVLGTTITVYSITAVDFEEYDRVRALEELKNFFIDKHKSGDFEKKLMNYGLVENLNKNLDDIQKTTENNSQAEIIAEKLKKCLALPIFKDITRKSERWRMTQIFTNDVNYHKAYLILKKLNDVLDFSFAADETRIFYERLDKIYEYWILAKILEYLVVKLDWSVENGDDPIKIFRDFFDTREKNSSACIKLRRDDMTMWIYYDTPISISLGNTNRELRPDYLFKITQENSAPKFFILDAKYRDYGEQGYGVWLYKDLKDVCLKKYVDEIFKETKTKIKISMSFIVHSDRTHNENFYLGKYVVYNGTVDERCRKISTIKDGSKQQFGSFYLLPNTDEDYINQSEENLMMFFSMIFEYFMDKWKDTCWQCGSNTVNVKTPDTAGGYLKYYMKCPQCGAFWVKNHCYNCHDVKLIKHSTNYHVEINNQTWYVHCPKCGI